MRVSPPKTASVLRAFPLGYNFLELSNGNSKQRKARQLSLLHFPVGRGEPQILNHRRRSAGDHLGRYFT